MIGDNSTASFSRSDPIGFSFNAKINLALDGRNSYLGPKVSNLLVIVQDLGTSALEIGRGVADSQPIKLKTKDYTPFTATIHFKYRFVLLSLSSFEGSGRLPSCSHSVLFFSWPYWNSSVLVPSPIPSGHPIMLPVHTCGPVTVQDQLSIGL